MQMCDYFMQDLMDFIESKFLDYIKCKRDHQMRKLIKKCYEKQEKYGIENMLKFLRNDNNKQKSKLPWTVKE